MSCKILILVLSSKKPPYDLLYEAQKRTWDSVSVPSVETRYYFCDGFETMVPKLLEALGEALKSEWDFVFRTNSSSYVDKKALIKFAEDLLPREKCYAGIDGDGFASGSGFFLSRDCAKALCGSIGPRKGLIEDEWVGAMLKLGGVSVLDGVRADFWDRRVISGFAEFDLGDEDIRTAYHVRCKSDTLDRDRDVIAMETVHQIKGFSATTS